MPLRVGGGVMPCIFDNIEQQLLDALRESLDVADRADFCVGYFNLRGWKSLDSFIERWTDDDGHCRRLLVGMQKPLPPQTYIPDSICI